MEPERTMPVRELAGRCAQEMGRRTPPPGPEPRHCYELFRRALLERDEEAWSAVYAQYYRLVHRWLGDAGDDADALVNQAFERLWRAVPPERFADFSTLGKILQYLKCCARTLIIDERRRADRRERAVTVDLERLADLPAPAGPDGRVDPELYRYLLDCLNDSREELVFRASIEWELAPGDIAGRWPGLFEDAREVSRTKERIFRRLQRDRKLRAWLGLPVQVAEKAGPDRSVK